MICIFFLLFICILYNIHVLLVLKRKTQVVFKRKKDYLLNRITPKLAATPELELGVLAPPNLFPFYYIRNN